MTTLTSNWQEIYRTSKDTGYGNQYVIFYAYATENIADNTSTVHTLIRTTVEGSGNYVSVSSWDAASDTQSTSGGSTVWYAGNDYNLLESAWVVSHNADGTGSVSIGMVFHSSYNIKSADYRVTVGLQTIPRTSNVTLNKSTATLNGSDGFVIYTNRQSSSFSHNLYQNVSGSWVQIASGVGDSYTWIPSTDFYANIGNESKTYQIICQTWSGGTHIGDSQVNFTLASAGISQDSLSASSIVLNGSNGVTIYTNRKSSSFTHTIQQNINGTFVPLATGVVDSTSWTPANTYYPIIGDRYKDVTIRCITYSGSTLIGQSDVNLRINSAGADAVSLSNTNMTMGDSYTVSIAKKISDFRHTITWAFENASGQLGTEKGVDASVGWTPSPDLSARIKTSMSGTGTVTCQTYYEDTPIGSTSVAFNLSVPNYNVVLGTPTITEEGTDAKTPANNLTTYGVGDTEILAIMSIKRLIVSATTSYGATITNISVTFGGKTLDTSNNTDKSTFNNTFNGMLNGILSITATDSRNRSSTYSKTYSFRSYFLPTITAFSGDRTAQDTGTLTATGTFWNATAGTTANTVTGAISQSATGTAALTKTDNTWTTSYAVTGVTYTNSYPFTITITDSFGNKATKTYTLPVFVPVLWKGKHTVRIRDFLIVNRVIKTAKLVLTEALTGVTATFTGTVTAPTFVGNLQGNADTATNATKLLPSGDNSLAYWQSLSQGSYFATPNILTSQPSGYGMIMITRFGSDVCVLWKGQNDGALFIKGVNGGEVSPWRQVMDTSNLLDHVYPVGSIYLQIGTTTSPASLFGGTWAALAGDWRMLLAGPASNGNNWTGGRLTTNATTLTAAQSGLPNHPHIETIGGSYAVTGGGPFAANWTAYGEYNPNTSHTTTNVQSTTSTGGWNASEGHTHSMDWNPYITVTAWKRTA